MSGSNAACILCGGGHLERLFDLGVLPLGSPVTPGDAPHAWRAPLAIAICRRCSMIQTEQQLPSDLLVSETFYTSHRAAAIAEHDRALAAEVVSRGLARPESLVLEVGCSDGSLLEKLQERGFQRLLGIEPSPHPGRAYPAEVIAGPFDAAMVRRLRDEKREPDLVIASHVLDGVARPADFIASLAAVLKPGGSLVVEVPYVVDLVDKVRIDAFAHARNAWFTAAALDFAMRRAGLRVDAIDHDDGYRGGSLRVFARRAPDAAPAPAVTALFAREAAALSAARFAAFRATLAGLRVHILSGVRALDGMPLYVYGAGLKAAGVLNWLGLSRDQIVCAVDNDPCKQGRLIPGVDVPIEPVDVLWRQRRPIAVLNLALDHRAEVEPQLAAGLPAGSMIVSALPRWEAVPVGTPAGEKA